MKFGERIRQRRHQAEIGLNRALGRVFLPHPRQFLYIETSSLCNLACAFCAYSKKSSPKTTMTNEFFFNVVEQATQMGYDRFGLTPITGDLFMDKHVMEKMEFLEQHPKVACYHFYSNFIIPERDTVLRLSQFDKLHELGISLYGHDQQSFEAMTKGSPIGYRRLLNNLDAVYDTAEQFRDRVQLHWRVQSDVRVFDHPESALVDRVRRLKQQKGIAVFFARRYNNWGGMVTDEDVAGLGIEVSAADHVPKNGACVLIFHKQQIMADGRVNACACRDADATLCLGDLRKDSLRTILSSANPTYMQLIDNQQSGRFNPICRSCDFYRSIYKHRKLHHDKRLSLDGFRREIDPAPQTTTAGMDAKTHP